MLKKTYTAQLNTDVSDCGAWQTRLFSPVPFLRVSALGETLGFEASKIVACHPLVVPPAAHGRGLTISLGSAVIPLADFRQPRPSPPPLQGATALIVKSQQRRFAIVVDDVDGPIAVDLHEVEPPGEALAAECSFLIGRVDRDNAPVFLVDIELLLRTTIPGALRAGHG